MTKLFKERIQKHRDIKESRLYRNICPHKLKKKSISSSIILTFISSCLVNGDRRTESTDRRLTDGREVRSRTSAVRACHRGTSITMTSRADRSPRDSSRRTTMREERAAAELCLFTRIRGLAGSPRDWPALVSTRRTRINARCGTVARRGSSRRTKTSEEQRGRRERAPSTRSAIPGRRLSAEIKPTETRAQRPEIVEEEASRTTRPTVDQE